MTRCVVTGGAGVIGQELVRMLRERGDEVHVVDRLPRPAAFDEGVTYVQGDLAELDVSAITCADPEVVYHLAAAFERSTENPDFWLQNARDNIIASQNVLRATCASPSVRRYVFASSYLVYDPEQFLLAEPPTAVVELAEDNLIEPRNVCGAAKLLHEKEAHLAAEDPVQNFSVVSARIYRVYGRSSRDVVSRWVRAALRDEAVTLYGPESYFDYIHARDVAEGLLRLASADVEGPVNLGSGRSQTVSAMVDNIKTHVPDFAVEGPHPADTYEASQADVTRLELATGWRPRISLEEGVADLVAHERDNLAAGTVSRRVIDLPAANVLISSVSRKAPLIRAVREGMESGLVEGSVGGADADPSVPTRPMLDWFWDMGRLDAMSDDEIVDGCLRRDVTIVIPTRDGELPRFAALRDRLREAGVFVAIGDAASVAACLDKVVTWQRCRDAGVPAIETATSIEGVEADRLVVKDRHGAGSRALLVDASRDEAAAFAAGLDEPIFQPFVEGDEFSIDAYVAADGAVVSSLVRRRSTVVAGESQVTESVDRPDIDDLARRALGALGVRGHAVVQVIDGPNGPVLIEVNSRVGGASAAAFAGGVRSIEYMLEEARGETPSAAPGPSPAIELVRLPSDTITYG